MTKSFLLTFTVTRAYYSAMSLRQMYEKRVIPILDYIYLTRSINGHSIKLPASVARFYKNGEEQEFHSILSLWATGISCDIGAHIGVTTVIIARSSTRVLALEPSPNNFKYLKSTVRRNSLDNVKIYKAAVAKNSGIRHFALRHGRANNGNSIVELSVKEVLIEVKTLTLNKFNLVFDFIKIDAEGAEHEILQSSMEVIGECKRMILSLHIDIMKSNGLNPLDSIKLLLERGAVILDQNGRLLQDTFCEEPMNGIVELYVLFPDNEPNWQSLLAQAQKILRGANNKE